MSTIFGTVSPPTLKHCKYQVYGGIHSKKFGFYRMIAKRFPFAIYYDIKDKTVFAVAGLPMRQNPEAITKSLQNR